MFQLSNSEIYQVPIERVRSMQSRVIIVSVFLIGLLFILVGRLAYLQIVSHQDFAALSKDNQVQVVPVPPVRGQIYDRNGTLLAGNETVYRLAITPRYVDDLDSLLEKIGKIVPVSDEDISKFKRKLGVSNKHTEIVLKDFLSTEEVARVAVDRYSMPGVSIVTDLHRVYSSSLYTSHVVGTLGQIDKQDLQKVDPVRYRGLRHVGKLGMEMESEEILVGSSGHNQVETNAHGRKIRVLSRAMPTAGSDIYLTIDLDLQKFAYDALGDEVGGLVAIEPSTGQILAMVSKPSFDSNVFGIGWEQNERKDLLTSEDRPLLNRAVQGQYPPGSTIKPFLAFAAFETGIGNRKFHCPGWYQLPDYSRQFRCWKSGGHGYIDLFDAIAESCDVYFYELAHRLGIDEMYYQLSKFGFGSLTGVELSYESAGILPSKEWKQWAKGEPWYEGETLITGIGQGATLVNMLQLAHATSIIANRGVKIRPQLIHKTVDIQGEEYLHEPNLIEVIDVNERFYDPVIKAMEKVVHGNRGTARRLSEGMEYRMAGKTGTVQIVSRKKEADRMDLKKTDKKFHPHGIFTAFAPADNPKIVVAVIVENGASGSAIEPIARAVIDHYLLSEPETADTEGDSFAIVTDH